MIEVRFHGRGGQGTVTAAELMAQAAIAENMYAQAFPNFGPERRGAPVTAFLRLSDCPIFLRERIVSPDVVVVLDQTLIGLVDVTEGLLPGKTVVINTRQTPSNISKHIARCYTLALVDASEIAVKTLTVPIANTAIIGALIKAIGTVSLEALDKPIKQRFGRLAEKNLLAMRKAFDETNVTESSSYDEATCDIEHQTDWETTIRKKALLPWQEVEIGCDVHRPGSCSDFQTGNWRTAGHPVIDQETCISCGICWIMCPDMVFYRSENGGYTWDGRYCKGCGICAAICSKQAISMEEER